jgi:radical SAM protein with 4Fe4S-binding SPASM domain
MLASSFDGPELIHDQCRGVSGAFKRTVQGIQTLLTERKKHKQKSPFFLLCATVSQTNQHHLEEMFNIAARIKPDCLILYLSWFTSKNLGEEHARILKNELGVDAVTWKSYIGQNEKIDVTLLQNTLKKLKKKKYPFPWLLIPSIPLNKLETYYKNPSDFLGYGPCVSPYFMVDIMPNGDVVTCRDYVDVKVGNITEKPLLTIWNDQPFRKFRQVLIKHNGLLPQCSRCCGLMGF